VDAAFRRAAQYGAGWMMGGGTPDMFKESVVKLESAWSDAGRDGQPRKLALAYFSLGPDAEQNADRAVGGYYKFLGEEGAKQVAGSVAKDAGTVKGYVSAFEDAGCDELILFPSDAGADQVTLLREALG
jgi:alkanesulfonate monooxygenase SsuD/methylene tetrahydromethanopterin reductase-like flavin-dependent oxidoreductase (luciferase family)